MRNETMYNLEQALVRALTEIRQRLADSDISDMELNITASGRVMDGDLEVNFTLGPRWSTGEAAKGGRLAPVIDEYLRRNEWKRKNAALLLTNQGAFQQVEDHSADD